MHMRQAGVKGGSRRALVLMASGLAFPETAANPMVAA